jgi:uncharacterized protein YggE
MNSDFMQEFFGTKVSVSLLSVCWAFSRSLIAQTISTNKSMGRSGNPATDVITVSGDGQATLPPDVARVSFTVEYCPAVADAQAATTKQANTAIDYVKGQGIAEKDVKTLAYNITPQYSYSEPVHDWMMCPTYGGSP